ncbi:hypothetical protein IEQ34_016139 [Dendrobium chrysotoxum]|uniref:Uncharacterized protein n=1 Tax=Dendrobium chrysotoxum TaxID=161865 RepID=A0AAV7FWU3_DENCH|nr:hypothetical protein IEQ34_016139 [Dendrobium chrysotoxum]
MDIISSLPADCIQIIQWLLEGNGLAAIIQFLKSAKLGGPSKNEIIENAARALYHFRIPTNFECQKKAVQAGVISDLVHLLECGTSLSKRYAAISLAQFSENSFKLTKLVEKPWGFFCCAAVPEEVCKVHNVNEAALIALSTLNVDERLKSGSKPLYQMNGIAPTIKMLNYQSPDVQVKAALVLEWIFHLEEYQKCLLLVCAHLNKLVDIHRKRRIFDLGIRLSLLAHQLIDGLHVACGLWMKA